MTDKWNDNSQLTMKPFDFCLENALEMIDDSRRKELADEARRFADGNQEPRMDFGHSSDYFRSVILEHERIFWRDIYFRRVARIKRIKVGRETTGS